MCDQFSKSIYKWSRSHPCRVAPAPLYWFNSNNSQCVPKEQCYRAPLTNFFSAAYTLLL